MLKISKKEIKIRRHMTFLARIYKARLLKKNQA